MRANPTTGPSPALRTVVAAAGSIAAITMVARVVGFGRWFAFSHSVGATCVGSVYQSVNAVPNVIFEVAAGGVLAAVAVPLVAGALARGDRGSADATASALLTWALLVLLPLGALVLVAARPIAAMLLGTGCAGETQLGADLLGVFAVQLPLYGIAIVLAGVLQAHRRFVAAALAPLVSSLVVIATYLSYRAVVPQPAAEIAAIPPAGVRILAIGTTVGVAAMALTVAVPIWRAGVRLRPRISFADGSGARVRSLALAGFLAVAGQQLATLVVIRLANDRGGAGTLNVFMYAQAVALLPYAVLAVPLATAAFPGLAHALAVGRGHSAAAGRGGQPNSSVAGSVAASVGASVTGSPGPGLDARTHRRVPPEVSLEAHTTLRHSWFGILVVGIAGAALLAAVAGPVGAFFTLLDAGGAATTSGRTLAAMPQALAAFTPTVPALGAIALLSRACYLRGRAVLAGAVVGTAWLATTVVPLVLLDSGGTDGPTTVTFLALGSSVGLACGAVVLAFVVMQEWGRSVLKVPWRPLIATVLGALVAGTAGWSVGTRFGDVGLLGALALAAVVGLGAALVLVVVALTVDPTLPRRLRRLRAPTSRAETSGVGGSGVGGSGVGGSGAESADPRSPS